MTRALIQKNVKLMYSFSVLSLVRFALMATHTNEQVDRAVAILTKIFKEQGIIK